MDPARQGLRQHRYSGLDEINTANVAQLRRRATFSTGVLRGQEAAPLVVSNTMYVVTPFPNILYALDLTQPGAPVKWKYEPKPLAAAQGVACCDVVNRGAVVRRRQDLLQHARQSHRRRRRRTPARRSGRPSSATSTWARRMTMAPLVVKDKVLVGNSGGEFGVRGWLTALDRRQRQARLARVQHRARHATC